jgi:hypothetical protein
MPPVSQEQAKLLRQLVLSGMVDKIAKYYTIYLYLIIKKLANKFYLLDDMIM